MKDSILVPFLSGIADKVVYITCNEYEAMRKKRPSRAVVNYLANAHVTIISTGKNGQSEYRMKARLGTGTYAIEVLNCALPSVAAANVTDTFTVAKLSKRDSDLLWKYYRGWTKLMPKRVRIRPSQTKKISEPLVEETFEMQEAA